MMKAYLRNRLQRSPALIRLLHWEYWPFHVVYGPIYFYWLWLCLRARSFFFFNAANPGIRNGGFLMESKKEIYDLLPPAYYPQTILVKAESGENDLLIALNQTSLSFPLIAKPDIGMRGLAVQKLETFAELVAYAASSRVDFLVQDFVPWEKEVGIFYYRYPDAEKGRVSGVVAKEFLTVTGDGRSTVKELLLGDTRYVLQLPVLETLFPEKLQTIPADREAILLVPYGNHARGAKFTDITHLVDGELEHAIDGICRQVPGFYYGRLDIRYRDWEALKQGRDFSVIELNGAGSEPTHIYDPSHSLFFAWQEIIRHWQVLFHISRKNYRLQKGGYLPVAQGIAMFRQNTAYLRKLSPSKSPVAPLATI